MVNLRVPPSRAAWSSMSLVVMATLAALWCSGGSAGNGGDDPLEAWVRAKGLEMGLNADAQVFAARGSGRDRLESLAWAIGDFSEWLGCDRQLVTDAGDKRGAPATKSSSMRSTNCLRGYDVEFISQRTKPGGSERILVIRREDRLVCMAHRTRLEGASPERIHSFFPTVDKARRAAVEEDLVATFVTDSFAQVGDGGESVECVFLFDCKPKGRNE